MMPLICVEHQKWIDAFALLLLSSLNLNHFAEASTIIAGEVEKQSSIEISVGKHCYVGDKKGNVNTTLHNMTDTCGARQSYCDYIDEADSKDVKKDELDAAGRKKQDEEKCGIYLAQSTIPFSGLGMFAGKSYNEGDNVTQGDIVIPLSEMGWNNGYELEDYFLWDEYEWSGHSFPGLEEETDYSGMIQGCGPGIGAALNCMLPLVNLVDIDTWMDNTGLHRSKDPGAGAFTIVHDRRSTAKRDIVPGEELFIDYGENYFITREEEYGIIPLHEDYEEADELIHRFDSLLQSLQKKKKKRKKKKKKRKFSEELMTDLYSLMTNLTTDSRTLKALPANYSDVDYVLREGTGMQYYNRSIRSLDWLKENGQCADNIYPGRSTVKQAGRGAFANRFIPEGGLVSPAPLIPIKNKETLLMYNSLPADEDGNIERNASSPSHYQLLLNYVFGHPNSTLLLSPYSLFTSLINHASASSDKVNCKIVWAETMRSPEWMDQPIDEWTHKEYSGLQFDFIATRDIQPHEEIFIDYGQQWDIAWDTHVRNWKPKRDNHFPDRPYVPAFELHFDPDLVMKTSFDDEQYSPNVQIFLREEYRLMYGLKPDDNEKELHRCRLVSRFHPQNHEEPLYLVELVKNMKNKRTKLCYVKVIEVLFNIPRDAFDFVDKAFTRDHQMKWSFRHEMIIPDEIFPELWKNKV